MVIEVEPAGSDRVAGRSLFHVRTGGVADELADRLGGRRPVVTGLVVWAAAFAILAVSIVGLGVLLTRVVLPAGLGAWDLDVSRWFVARRTPTLNAVTLVGSELGSTPAIVGVAVIAAIVLIVRRCWSHLAFLICALSLEFAVFLTATFIIDRARPGVPRLDPSPVTSSYPSGHAAASLTLYLAIAIVATSFVRSAIGRTLIWTVALAVPALVAISRVYRGMHHLTDVSVSVLLAGGALLFALLTVRSAVAASDRREDTTPYERTVDHVLEEAS